MRKNLESISEPEAESVLKGKVGKATSGDLWRPSYALASKVQLLGVNDINVGFS